jgi:hypothetical protein
MSAWNDATSAVGPGCGGSSPWATLIAAKAGTATTKSGSPDRPTTAKMIGTSSTKPTP